jgi:hypothetical protein
MPSTIVILKDYLIDGSKAVKDQVGYKEVHRVVVVGGISTAGQTQIDDAFTVLPAMGSAHPATGMSYLLLDEADVIPLTPGGAAVGSGIPPGTVRATLVYRRMAPGGSAGDSTLYTRPVIELGGGLRQVEVNTDYAASPLSVSYFGTKERSTGEDDTQIATTTAYISSTVVRFLRREAITISDLATKVATYKGHVNGDSWLGDGAKTWLCYDISGKSIDGNQHFDVTYEFHHCGDTPTGDWKSRIWWRGANGKVPSDAVDANGRDDFNLFPWVNFSELSLP